ncbi:adenosylcobinamide amidohydrolase [Phosphitispora sp. TUW77]|uniref:adenosylcobinamide amidohydrolase n=1 Tax=Phosphitispora sp. TUW77 TaxID=3152361 RepID=UPI003AB27016
MKIKLHTLSTGDSVYHNRSNRSIILLFEQPRKVLSTSLMNGGYCENLTAVFNHNSNYDGEAGTLQPPTYEEYMQLAAKEAGLDPDTVSGMGTAASMENVAIQSATYENLTVTAVVTGGVEINGGRVGDPATYFQPIEKSTLHKSGTINIMLVIDADMPPSSLARALVTCTEAKTAALQELMAGSNYSNGLATGSGTDQTIVIANPDSDLYLESAGKHSKLGELIGRVVKQAVKEALLLQTGLSPKMQHSVLRRMKRFGVTEETVWQEYVSDNSGEVIKPQFLEYLSKIDTDGQLVAYTSLYVHLLDQFLWELLPGEEVMQTGSELIALVAGNFGIPPMPIAGPELQDYVQAWAKLVSDIVKFNMSAPY